MPDSLKTSDSTNRDRLQQLLTKALETEFDRRQRSNSHYSIRAFSRDMGIHPGSLHGILRGNRQVPRKKIRTFFENLNYSDSQIDDLLAGNIDNRKTLDDIAAYVVIAEWEHFALLTLMDSDEFRSDHEYLAEKMGISVSRVEKVISNLERASLIQISLDGKISKSQGGVKTSEDSVSEALFQSHLEELEIAKSKLAEFDVSARDFSSTMICMPKKNLSKAKSLIRDFRRQFERLCEDSAGKDVYQLCVQMYPLTIEEGRIGND